MPKLKSYHFDFGDSSNGPIGYCARVWAHSKREAVELLREALPLEVNVSPLDGEGSVYDNESGIEYITVYLNDEAVTEKSIDDWEDCE
jgi:hypothetical protein